jgi:hypothetical protein
VSTLTLKKKCVPVVASVESKAPPAPLDETHFYFLWRVGGKRPTQRHPSLNAALIERDRLAGEYPGALFYIFEAKRIDP